MTDIWVEQTKRKPARRVVGWSFQLGVIAGIPLRVHATFVLLMLWISISHLLHGHGWSAALNALTLMGAMFAAVVLHELGHALMARRYGIRTLDITLLPIGGVARLERVPTGSGAEVLIALAGPLVNVALAGAAFLALQLSGSAVGDPIVGSVTAPLLPQLFWLNLWLAAFNLLPAFPMDGGRVLRGLLAARIPHANATRYAALIGQGFALLFGLVGLLVNPILILIALFIWIAAQEEAQASAAHSVLSEYSAAEAMVRDVDTVPPGAPLSSIIDRVLGGFQQDFPVVEDGRIVGVLTFRDLLRGLSAGGKLALVRDHMSRRFGRAKPGDALDAVLERAREAEMSSTVIVAEDGQLLGVVEPHNVRELLRIRGALGALEAEPRQLAG